MLSLLLSGGVDVGPYFRGGYGLGINGAYLGFRQGGRRVNDTTTAIYSSLYRVVNKYWR